MIALASPMPYLLEARKDVDTYTVLQSINSHNSYRMTEEVRA